MYFKGRRFSESEQSEVTEAFDDVAETSDVVDYMEDIVDVGTLYARSHSYHMMSGFFFFLLGFY